MNQNSLHTPPIIDAIQAVIQYLWETEQDDYVANPRPDHIFLSLKVLAEATQEPG